MIDGIVWFFTQLGMASVNIVNALLNAPMWLDWSDPQAIMRFVYYGGSVEFFFAVFLIFLVVTGVGIWWRNFMWGCVRVLEGIANAVGRFAAWAGLFMVLQQILIVFLQRIFRVAEISISPFGMDFTKDLSWFGEELKLYNAMIVALCISYTFVQGGHVRVDLIYAGARHGTKRFVDMFGSLFFMMPMAVLIWMYGWFFMWRHLITPKVSASDTLERLLAKARVVRWNVETIGFSPNGFNGYFLFKVLMVMLCGLIFLQAVATFYRSFLEWREGEEATGKHLDKDVLGDNQDVPEGAH